MKYLFSKLSGFSEDTMRHLPEASAIKIEWLSFWTFLSVFFSCFSVAFIIQISTKVWLLSILSFLFLFFVLFLIQSLLVTSSFIEIETTPGNIYKWKPTRARVIIFAFVGIIFSQPLIFLYESIFLVPTTNISLEKIDQLKKNIIKKIDSFEADKKLAISQKKNLIALINGEQSSFWVANDVKKALIVFNEKFDSTQVNLSKRLESLGFQVNNITAVNSDNFNFALTQYAANLKPGDVSLIFFLGKYKVDQGKFYLLPSDENSNIKDAVDLQSYISQFNKSKTLASLFVFNLVEDSSSSFYLAANRLQASPESLVLLKHGGAQESEIDKFIGSLLEKLSSTETIKSSFSALVQNEGTKANKKDSLRLIDNLKQTIYLNKPKEVKALSTEESVQAIKGYCSKFAGAGRKYSTACLSSQINVLQSSIDYLEDVKRAELDRMDKLKVFRSKNPSVLVNYFHGIEKDFITSFIFTVIAIFFISGGFFIRDIATDSVEVYERFNFKRNRVSVLMDFRKFRLKAKGMRLGFMDAHEKVSIANFPNPFRALKVQRISINRSPNASDDFFDAIKTKLKSGTERI